MPRCTHCGHDFAMSEGFSCPSCGKDWRGGAPAASTDGAPAHLAVLDGAPPREPKKRIVSTAGPAVPVPKKQDDSVPNGWMARLEAARVVARGDAAAEAAPPQAAPTPPPRPPSVPPPLKPALQKKSGVEAKPAHLLVAQLEADEQRRRDQEQARLTELFKEEEPEELISKVEVALPEAPTRKKKIPDWVIVVALGGLVLGGIAFAYNAVQKEPTPEAKIDPELARKAELRKQAMHALEKGHTLALQGKAHADEAIVAYQEALSLEPTLASAERGIAIVYASKDDDDTAVHHYRRYLELAPDAKDADDVKAIIARWEKAKKRKKR